MIARGKTDPMTKDEVLRRNNVNVVGAGEHTLVLAHGFGCDQNMWRFMIPSLSKDFRLVLFDYVGSGRSDISEFDSEKYSVLAGYAEDVLDVCCALELKNATFVGHSVSSMIGLIAATVTPERFSSLVMVCPSPCFLNFPPNYYGGFEKEDLEELIGLMDKNYIGWAQYLAPLVMGTENSGEMVKELTGSFCSTDPMTAKAFAKATFFSDMRDQLSHVQHPTLILQSSDDALAAPSVGDHLHREIAHSKLKLIKAKGHCLHMTHPHNVSSAVMDFVSVPVE